MKERESDILHDSDDGDNFPSTKHAEDKSNSKEELSGNEKAKASRVARALRRL